MLNRKSNEWNYSDSKSHLLRGLVYCKKCKAKITYNKNHGKYFRCICSTYKKQGSKFCNNIHLREDTLIEAVLSDIRKQIKKLLKYEDLEFTVENKQNNKKIEFIEAKIKEKDNLIKSLYEDKVNNIISEDLFIKLYEQYEDEKKTLKSQIKKEMTNNTTLLEKEALIQNMKELLAFKEENIDRSLLFKLIDRIEINDKNVEIYYKFINK